MRELSFDGSFEAWKRTARDALLAGWPPEETHWVDRNSRQDELGFSEPDPPRPEDGPGRLRVPRAFMELAREAACHRDPERWARLYRVLWRLLQGEPHVLEVALDSEVRRLEEMAKAVRRDQHKMRAFVRFRAVPTEGGPWFVAWFEPQHHIVEANAPFFIDRFPGMPWSILTPECCAHWDRETLRFTPGVDRAAAPRHDAVENLWRTYYASIFNPARIKIEAMTSEMPRHYWRNLPETTIIPHLLAEAPARTATMVAASEQKRIRPGDFGLAPVPLTDNWAELQQAAAACRACPLWRTATCTVFGEGPRQARVVLVGEQPGDQEDRVGRPFVGPAGQLLDRALAAAGIAREQVYLTNAVKHFKWEPRGKRRLHQRPGAREVAACRPWLEAELRAIRPQLIVCLGATAANSVLGGQVRILSERGTRRETEFGVPALLTVHPSSLLRLPDGTDPDAAFQEFVADLRLIAE